MIAGEAGEDEGAPDAVLASPGTLAWLRGEWAAGRLESLRDAPLVECHGAPDGVVIPAYRTPWGWQPVNLTILHGFARHD